MTEEGEDPWELDPFGTSEYAPNAAFARHAAQQAERLRSEAEAFVAQELHDYAERSNPLALTAAKSMQVHLDGIRLLASDAHRLSEQAIHDRDEDAAALAIEALDEAQRLNQLLQRAATQIRTDDPELHRPAQPPITPSDLVNLEEGRKKLIGDLRSHLNVHIGSERGALIVTKATPGVGKTHAMIETAYEHHRSGRRVVFAARTKGMIRRTDGELAHRVLKRSPTGRLSLAVIHGRDETNCHKHETVEAVMAHGYSPFIAVCRTCEHFPHNAVTYGLPVCGYYDERMSADRIAKQARKRLIREYPFVLTTHASVVAATNMGGQAKYGSFWPYDVCYFDEDPTDALEVDIHVTEEHAQFTSMSPRTEAAGVSASVFREAIEIAKEERSIASENGYKAPGADEYNSHPIHTQYDTCYAAQDLWELLERARQKVSLRLRVEPLASLLRAVHTSGGFHIDAGSLGDVDDAEEINRLDIPPKTLQDIAGALHDEANHRLSLRRQLFDRTYQATPHQLDPSQHAIETLEQHTDLGLMSYQVRLECIPADVLKGRPTDEWRFVFRQARTFDNRTSTLVVGDGYAQWDHYEELFDRPVNRIEITSELHPDARIIRVIDDVRHTISSLEKGGIYDRLKLIEAQVHESVREGERVLFYTHMALKPRIDEWLQGLAERIGFGGWAVEHWWGGRGKDQYDAWEHTFCISDPIQSLSGIAHVANARAWRDSRKAKTLDEQLLHAKRCQIGDGRHGAISALRGGHPRIEKEHDRMNVSELTQAMHRSRPVHNASNIYVYGGMEQSQDLVAQTHTFFAEGASKLDYSNAQRKDVSKRRAKQLVVTHDRFVSVQEAMFAIRAIIAHYGVYSSWFAHALQVVPDRCVIAADGGKSVAWMRAVTRLHDSGRAVPNIGRKRANLHTPEFSESVNDPMGFGENLDGTKGAVFNYLTLKTAPLDRADPARGGSQTDSQASALVHEEPAASAVDGRRSGATEPAFPPGWEPLPNPAPIIERVWHPGPHWDIQVAPDYFPKPLQLAHDAILRQAQRGEGGLGRVQAKRLPKWAKGRGLAHRLPFVVYDESLMGNFANALQVYQAIVERQYAAKVQGGHLVRPRAVLEVPSSRSDVPF